MKLGILILIIALLLGVWVVRHNVGYRPWRKRQFSSIRWILWILVALLALSGIGLVGASLGKSSTTGLAPVPKSAIPSPSASASAAPASVAPVASTCPEGFNVDFDPNDGNKVSSTTIDVADTAIGIGQIEALAKRDPRALQLYYNSTPLGTTSVIHNYQELYSGSCYTALGREKYSELVGALASADKTPSVQAPTYGINTGVVANGAPFQEAPGPITGNLISIKVDFKNSKGKVVYTVYFLYRCGNSVVTVAIPVITIKTTPPPVPKPKPTPTPTHSVCSCPTPSPTPSKVIYCTETHVPVPPNGLCPKNPSKGPDNNPSIPAGVRQSTPPPDNAQPVISPSDGGNGFASGQPGPRVSPSAAPTHVSGPTPSTQPTQPASTPSPIQASPTASSSQGVGPHGP